MIVKPLNKNIVIKWAEKHGWEYKGRSLCRWRKPLYSRKPGHYEYVDNKKVWVEEETTFIEGEYQDNYIKGKFQLVSAASNLPLFDSLT